MTRKRVTMKDIADKLNLSINAVSLALNDKTGVGEETKRLILNTAEESICKIIPIKIFVFF